MKATIFIAITLLVLMLEGCGSVTTQSEPHLLHVVRTESIPVIHYPAYDRTITDMTEVQKLYALALALPAIASGSSYNCPADNGLVYQFQFQKVATASQMKLDATGCQFLTITGAGVRQTDASFINLVARDLGFVNLSDQNPIMP